MSPATIKQDHPASDCQALITGGAQGGVPLTFWPLNDATATLKISSVAASSGGVAVYTGSDIPSGLCADSTNPNPVITITGFVKTENNGAFSCKSSAPKTLTLVNTAAVPESNLAQAAYPGAMAEAISRDKAAYTGPAVLDSVAGIPGDTTRTKRAALFGGDTLYSYYLWETDFNGGVTHVSPAAYVANFPPRSMPRAVTRLLPPRECREFVSTRSRGTVLPGASPRTSFRANFRLTTTEPGKHRPVAPPLLRATAPATPLCPAC